ncbi:MAG: hypothetical protein J1F38_03740 [Muribaculaceae bacterium]|nr:hypothetical protein [Muribaculaceae bacterium]
MKGLKYILIVVVGMAWAPTRAESNPEADPDYRYIVRKKIDTSLQQKKDSISDMMFENPPRIMDVPNKAEKKDSISDMMFENPPRIMDVPNKTERKDSISDMMFENPPLIMPVPVTNKENVIEAPEAQECNLPVVNRPDTVYVEAKPQSHEIEEFQRDIESVVFIPKGCWIFGLSVSYTQSSQDKYQFLILEGISGDTYSFKVSPMAMFTVKADLGLGARFAYARNLTKVANADIVLDAETDYSFDHLYRLSHNYYGTILMRNYFSIGKSKRFGFFNEVGLQLGGGQSKLTTGVGEDLTGTYEHNFSLNVGLTPGICIFLNNYSALEVNVGLLGFNYNKTKAVKDQIYVSNRNYQSANFRINLFSITFGATFYI